MKLKLTNRAKAVSINVLNVFCAYLFVRFFPEGLSEGQTVALSSALIMFWFLNGVFALSLFTSYDPKPR